MGKLERQGLLHSFFRKRYKIAVESSSINADWPEPSVQQRLKPAVTIAVQKAHNVPCFVTPGFPADVEDLGKDYGARPPPTL